MTDIDCHFQKSFEKVILKNMDKSVELNRLNHFKMKAIDQTQIQSQVQYRYVLHRTDSSDITFSVTA